MLTQGRMRIEDELDHRALGKQNPILKSFVFY